MRRVSGAAAFSTPAVLISLSGSQPADRPYNRTVINIEISTYRGEVCDVMCVRACVRALPRDRWRAYATAGLEARYHPRVPWQGEQDVAR